MDKTYLLYQIDEVRRLVDVLKSTIDRRFPPDEAVDNALITVQCEIQILVRTVQTKLIEEK